jgi:HSP20 family molecular chaperone IbpA
LSGDATRFARLQETIVPLPTFKKRRCLVTANRQGIKYAAARMRRNRGNSETLNHLVSFPIYVSREMERLFDEMIHRPWGFCREMRGWNPSVDLYEMDDAFVLEADLPGVKLDDVKVEIENSFLLYKAPVR